MTALIRLNVVFFFFLLVKITLYVYVNIDFPLRKQQKKMKMNKLFFTIFLFAVVFACGNDDGSRKQQNTTIIINNDVNAEHKKNVALFDMHKEFELTKKTILITRDVDQNKQLSHTRIIDVVKLHENSDDYYHIDGLPFHINDVREYLHIADEDNKNMTVIINYNQDAGHKKFTTLFDMCKEFGWTKIILIMGDDIDQSEPSMPLIIDVMKLRENSDSYYHIYSVLFHINDVREYLKTIAENSPKIPVVIKCEPNAPLSKLITLLDMCKEFEFTKIKLIKDGTIAFVLEREAEQGYDPLAHLSQDERAMVKEWEKLKKDPIWEKSLDGISDAREAIKIMDERIEMLDTLLHKYPDLWETGTYKTLDRLLKSIKARRVMY